MKTSRDKLTFASVPTVGLEAVPAGAEGVGAVDHAVGLVSVSTHRPVAAAVVQRRVCGRRNEPVCIQTAMEACGGDDHAAHTFLVAVDLVGAIVFAVVEVVAAEDGADAASVGALELILLTYGCRRSSFWKTGTDMIYLFIYFLVGGRGLLLM